MTKTARFLSLAFLVVFSRFYDIYTTYLYTPDLQHETNVLVKFLGAGWTGVLMLQGLMVLLIIYCLYYYLFRFQRPQVQNPDLNMKEYISMMYFGNTTSFHKLLYTTPKNKNVLFATLGYVVAMTLITSGLIVGSSTLCLLLSEKYGQFYAHRIPYLLYMMIVLLAVYFSFLFYKSEYKEYKKSSMSMNE